jgi:hypothetical protein
MGAAAQLGSLRSVSFKQQVHAFTATLRHQLVLPSRLQLKFRRNAHPDREPSIDAIEIDVQQVSTHVSTRDVPQVIDPISVLQLCVSLPCIQVCKLNAVPRTDVHPPLYMSGAPYRQLNRVVLHRTAIDVLISPCIMCLPSNHSRLMEGLGAVCLHCFPCHVRRACKS